MRSARSRSFVASQGRSMAKKLAARPTSAAGSFGAASTLRFARNQRPQASRAACDAGAEGFMLFRLGPKDSCSFEAYGVLWQSALATWCHVCSFVG